MKISGFRHTDADNPGGIKVYINKVELKPGDSQKVFNHSPDGFEWGYFGSGPAQLALAILLKVTTVSNAVKYHQWFKRDFVAKWAKNDDFEVTIDVKNWVLKQKKLW